MFIIHSGEKYNIDELAKYSEYFECLANSPNFSENQNGYLDLSHRDQPMKDVLDMIIEKSTILKLSSDRLKKMEPILDEFIVSLDPMLQSENWQLVFKEGKICKWCDKINKWIKPKGKLSWDDERDYCSCNYIRDDWGNRISFQQQIEEYYSSDENRKYGSSLFYT